VTKVLLLRRHEGDDAKAPELEVATRTELGPNADPVLLAAGRGTVVATLLISKDLPALFPKLPDERLIAFCLRGPKELSLSRESSPDQFDNLPLPVPAHFALVAGTKLRFQLSGPPVAAGEPIYASLMLPAAAPEKAGLVLKTVMSLTLSTADLDAARAGRMVTCVIYQSSENEENSPRLQSLSSAQMESGGDPVAEASQRGVILAVLKLSNKLAELTPGGFEHAPDADSAAEPPAIDATIADKVRE
jgi:hypothetical protein